MIWTYKLATAQRVELSELNRRDRGLSVNRVLGKNMGQVEFNDFR